MVNGNDRNLITVDPVYDDIRESPYPHESIVFENFRKQIRVQGDQVESLFDVIEIQIA